MSSRNEENVPTPAEAISELLNRLNKYQEKQHVAHQARLAVDAQARIVMRLLFDTNASLQLSKRELAEAQATLAKYRQRDQIPEDLRSSSELADG